MRGETTWRGICVCIRSEDPVGRQGMQEVGQRGVEGELEFEDQLLCKELDDWAA